MTDQTKLDPETASCVLTARLTFADRVDVDDAIDTVEVCMLKAISIESSIEEVQPGDAREQNRMTGDPAKPDPEEARHALTVRVGFGDRIDAEDAMDRMQHCLQEALSFEPSIEDA